MENREKKTVKMLVNKIEWQEIAETLDLHITTLHVWRKSGEDAKNQAIDLAVEKIIKEKNKQVQ